MSSVGADPPLSLSRSSSRADDDDDGGMDTQFEIGYSSVRLGSTCFSSTSTESFFSTGVPPDFLIFFFFKLCALEAGPRRHWPRLLGSTSGLAEFLVSIFVHPEHLF